MKYTENQINEIIQLSKAGVSSRNIAERVGVSKSGVNDLINRVGVERDSVEKKPRILLIDLENAPSVVATFGRFKQNLGIDSVIEEGGWLISAAWKWLDEEKIDSVVLTPEEAKNKDDFRIVATIYELLENADILVYQNGNKFDLPLIKTRCILNGFPPPKTVKTVDTLVIAKTLKFNSNRLDGLGKQLGCGRKVQHEGISLWISCMNGDKKALQKMQEYNVGDISLLESVYLQIRAFDPKTPSVGLFYSDEVQRCPACGSANVHETGNSIFTPLSEFSELVCTDCGHRSRNRKAVNTKEKRQSVLITPKS